MKLVVDLPDKLVEQLRSGYRVLYPTASEPTDQDLRLFFEADLPLVYELAFDPEEILRGFQNKRNGD